MKKQQVIKIRDIEAKPGKKTRGFIKVGDTPLGPIQMPVVMVSGTQPGPTLCLTAGVHATEYPAIDAVMRTTQSLNPEGLKGMVIAVPVVNQAMYQTRTPFISPIDGQNLNRMAPGRPDGTISEVIAHTLLEEIVLQADVHIDCHGGDMGEILLPYSGYPLSGNAEQDKTGQTIVRLYSPHIFALYDDATPLPPTNGSISCSASQRGTISMLAESGSNGTLEEKDVQIHLKGIRNVMRYLGMISGETKVVGDQLQAVGQFIIHAQRGGLLRLKIEIGEEITPNQVIAEIYDVFGNVVECVKSEETGIARIIWAHKVVNTGDPIVKCWIAEPAFQFSLEPHNL